MRFILTATMLLWSVTVDAHDAPAGWTYESYCCNGDAHNGDCQKIPARTVHITPRGYELSLEPGDHRLITRSHLFSLPMSKARRSQDGDYHLCLYPNEDTPRCFYAPDMDF